MTKVCDLCGWERNSWPENAMNLPAVYAAGSMSVIPGKICRATGRRRREGTADRQRCLQRSGNRSVNSRFERTEFERPDSKGQI